MGYKHLVIEEETFDKFMKIKDSLKERLGEQENAGVKLKYGSLRTTNTSTMEFLLDKFREYLELKKEKKEK